MNISRVHGFVNRLVPGYGCCHWARVRPGAEGDAEVARLSREALAQRTKAHSSTE